MDGCGIPAVDPVFDPVTQAEQYVWNPFRAVHYHLSGSPPYQHFGTRFFLPLAPSHPMGMAFRRGTRAELAHYPCYSPRHRRQRSTGPGIALICL